MPSSTYLLAHAAQLIAIAQLVSDSVSKAALIEMADEITRWANQIEGIDDPPKANGCH